MKEQLSLKEKIKAKIPGEDTGILLKTSFCDICSPAPSCGVNCFVKDGKLLKVEGIPGHPAGNGVLCTKGLALFFGKIVLVALHIVVFYRSHSADDPRSNIRGQCNSNDENKIVCSCQAIKYVARSQQKPPLCAFGNNVV